MLRETVFRVNSGLLDFIQKPRVPWFVMRWLSMHWPRAYHLLRFGTSNINTPQHWNDAWARHGQGEFRASAELSTIRRRAVELVPSGAVVLDVGCGSGELLSLVATERGCKCFGVDFSAMGIAKALDSGFGGCVSGLPAIPYATGVFDVVLCTETLEHVSDAKGTIAEIARVVRAGGKVIISVPDGTVDREDVHVHRFTPKRLRKMLSRHLRVRSIEAIMEDKYKTLLALAEK